MKLGSKIAAGVTTLLLAGAGLLVTAAPASAHTGDLNVSYTCDTTTGEYVGTAELTISQTGLAGVTNWKVGTTNFEGTPSSNNGLSGAIPSTGAGKITLGTFRLPGDTKTKGPWVYAFTTWSDGFKKGSDGQSYENLKGNCKVPEIPKDASATIVTTPATCEADGSARWDVLTNATGSELSQAVGAQSGVATAAQGHQFPDGSATQNVGYTIEPKLDPSKAPCYTPPPVINQCIPGQGNTSTNLVPLWSNVDTRSAGHYEYVENGLRVWTDDNSSQAKVSLGQAISFNLKNTGVLDLDWTGSTPPPGINLFVNFGADGTGTLVYESVYGQDLWLTNGSSAAVKANAPVNGGGNGSQWHGTINQWLEKYPDAVVTGVAFSLGSGVKGDGVINSITVNCAEYFFDYVEPAPQPEAKHEERTLTETDCEAKTTTLTYQERDTLEPTFDSATNTWSELVWGDWVTVDTEERAATAEECPVTPTPTPTPTDTPKPTPSSTPVTPVSGGLAQTGLDFPVFPAVLTGVVILGGGTWLLVMSLRRRKVESDSAE